MRHLSQEIVPEVEHFEKLQSQTSSKKDEVAGLKGNSLHDTQDGASALKHGLSSSCMEMPEIDYSVQVPPEVLAEENEGVFPTGGDNDEKEQRIGRLDIASADPPESPTSSGKDVTMSDQNMILSAVNSVAPKNPKRSMSPAATSLSKCLLNKHHCLLVGHVFECIRFSQLLPDDTVCELPPPSQRIAHQWKDLKMPCDLCQDLVEDELYQCQIKACSREVCKGCKKRLEASRRHLAKRSWIG